MFISGGMIIGGGMQLVSGLNIVRSGLILYIDANDVASYPRSGTTWYDLSGTGNNASLINGPTYTGVSGGAIVFDGNDDYVNAPLTSGFRQAMTVITFGKSNNATWNQFAGLGSARVANGYIIHNNQGTTNIDYYIVNSSVSNILLGGTSVSNIQNYQMYTLSTNGSNNHECYLNNTLVASSSTSITRTNSGSSQDNYLGRDMFGVRYNAVSIGVHMIYNRQLSAAEITQNYAALRSRLYL